MYQDGFEKFEEILDSFFHLITIFEHESYGASGFDVKYIIFIIFEFGETFQLFEVTGVDLLEFLDKFFHEIDFFVSLFHYVFDLVKVFYDLVLEHSEILLAYRLLLILGV